MGAVAACTDEIVTLEKPDLLRILPHQGEALVLDRVDIDFLAKEATGHFHVGGHNAHVLRGHFGILPGHWQYEIASLTCAVLALSILSRKEPFADGKRKGVRLIGMDGIRNRAEALPGEGLFCNASLLKEKGPFAFFSASLRKEGDGTEVCSIKSIVGVAGSY